MEIVWTVFEKIEVFIERSGEKTSRLHKLLPTAKREKGENIGAKEFAHGFERQVPQP